MPHGAKLNSCPFRPSLPAYLSAKETLPNPGALTDEWVSASLFSYVWNGVRCFGTHIECTYMYAYRMEYMHAYMHTCMHTLP